MIKAWKWIKNNPNRAMFLVPIILVAIISISHVVTWYDMANPINWAIYLSIAIEMAAMTALVAVDSKIKRGIWFMFGLVTLIQVIGNVFYCFKEIDATGELFKSWVELTYPIWEYLGTEPTDTISLKRWLAFLEGGLLPIISLTSLHFFITYKVDENKETEEYFDNRNKELEKVVMSKPEGKEFNAPYPFTDEMKEANKKSNESIVEEVAEDDYDSEGNLNFTPTASEPPVEEESKAESVKATTPTTSGEEDWEVVEQEDLIGEERTEINQKEIEIESARKEADEWARKEEEDRILLEEKKKQEEETHRVEKERLKLEELKQKMDKKKEDEKKAITKPIIKTKPKFTNKIIRTGDKKRID